MKSYLRISTILAVAFTLCIPAIASAKPFTHAKSKVSFDTPKNWNAELDTEDGTWSVEAESKDESGMIYVEWLDVDTIEKAKALVQKELKEDIEGVKIGDMTKTKVAGLNALKAPISGMIEKEKVEGVGYIIQTKSTEFFFVLTGGANGTNAKHQKTFDTFLKTIKSK